ncbi:MAG: galactose mutarotase [Muribaculaceae bacterium]|nr:galactose mutarotase [Muribaculaceae bacterium]
MIKTEKINTSRGEVDVITIENSCGASVKLCSLGASVMEIIVPDRNGRLADVAMGYADVESYWDDLPNSGKTAGRYANRIVHGKLTVAGVDYQLAVNCGDHHLHGGVVGFQHKNWTSAVEGDLVVFTHVSPDGDENYPGELSVKVTYRFTDENALEINYYATTSAATVVSLTNHTYFNLAGHDSGSALDHRLLLHASRYLEADSTAAPTGRLLNVEATPMDFRADSIIHAKPLRPSAESDFQTVVNAKGLDHCWVIDGWQKGKLSEVASLVDDCSGRVMDVFSTQPGVQVYTANWLTGSTPGGKNGADYNDYDMVAIECQGLPDAPNHSHFPSQELLPGQTYHETIIYKFSTK